MPETRTVRIEHEEEIPAGRVAEYIDATAVEGDRIIIDGGEDTERDYVYDGVVKT